MAGRQPRLTSILAIALFMTAGLPLGAVEADAPAATTDDLTSKLSNAVAEGTWTTDVLIDRPTVVFGSLTIAGPSADAPIHVRFASEKGASISLVVKGSLTIRHAVLEPATTGPLHETASSVQVSGSLDAERTTFRNVRVSGNETATVRLERVEFADVWDGMGGAALSLTSSDATVKWSRFHGNHRAALVQASATPTFDGNIFEANVYGVNLGGSAVARRNLFVANLIGVQCISGATVADNRFDDNVGYAVAGACAITGSDLAYDPTDPDALGGTVTSTGERQLTYADLGLPADVVPHFVVDRPAGSQVWTRSTDPGDGTPRIVMVTRGATLTLQGADPDLGGGTIATRKTGRLVTTLAGADRNDIQNGFLSLGGQTAARDSIQALDVLGASGPGGAIRVVEARPRIVDVVLRDNAVGILQTGYVLAPATAGRGLPYVERATIEGGYQGLNIIGNVHLKDSDVVSPSQAGIFGLIVTEAGEGALIEGSRFYGAKAGVSLTTLSAGAASATVRDSLVAFAELGIQATFITMTVAESVVRFNAVGIASTGATTLTSDDMRDNFVALGLFSVKPVTATSCASGDDVMLLGTAEVTTICPTLNVPLGFSLDHVHTSGTHTIPARPSGPVIAAGTARITATDATIDLRCDATLSACRDGLRFPIAAKTDGGITLTRSLVRNGLVGLGGDVATVARSTCRDCVVFATNPDGSVDPTLAPRRVSGTYAPNADSPSVSLTRLDGSDLRPSYASDPVLAENVLVERGQIVANRAAVTVRDSTVYRGSMDRDGGSGPAMTVERVSFGRTGSGVSSDAGSATASNVFWSAPCGVSSATCEGASASGTTVSSPSASALSHGPKVTFAPPAGTHHAGDVLSFSAAAQNVGDLSSGFAWDLGDGTTKTGNAITHAYAAPGSYPLRLAAVDTFGSSTTTTATIVVSDRPATVVPTYSPSRPLVGATVTFTDASTDGDGIVSRAWTFGDGHSASGASVTHAYAATGSYSAKLTITDTFGQSTSKTFTVAVVDGSAPEVLFTWCCFADRGYNVKFDDQTQATGITRWTWTWGDGKPSTTTTWRVSAYHQYAAAGAYQACLTLTFSDASTAQGCQEVRVDDVVSMTTTVTNTRLPANNHVEIEVKLADGTPVAGASITYRAHRSDQEPTTDLEEDCEWVRQVDVEFCYPTPEGTENAETYPIVVRGVTNATGRLSFDYVHAVILGQPYNPPGSYRWVTDCVTTAGMWGNEERPRNSGGQIVVA